MSERLAVVIGGGAAGLRVSCHLKAHKIPHIVLDRRPMSALRRKKWLYAPSHPLSCALARTPAADEARATDALRGNPLSAWDERALRTRNPLSADHADIVDGADASFGYGHPGVRGARLLAWRPLVDEDEPPSTLIVSTRVVDVRRRDVDYVVQCRCQERENFVNRSYVGTIIFICVSPGRAARWSMLQHWARAQLNAVFPLALGRLEFQAPDAGTSTNDTRSASSLAGRIVVDESGSAVCSTSGRIARFWNRLRRTAPALFQRLLLEEVDPTARDAAFAFSEQGSHAWRPAPSLDLRRVARRALAPNPRHLPNVYWCHNAFTTHPGLLEGDLEAADAAIRLVLDERAAREPRRRPRRDEVVVEGRVLRAKDIAPWMDESDAHAHKRGGDVTDDFYHSCDTPDAWAAVFALQTAFEL